VHCPAQFDLAMATEQESFELQGYHNPLALELEELEEQEHPKTLQQFPIPVKTNDVYEGHIPERKIAVSNRSSRRWKILTATMAVLAVSCLVAFIYVLGQWKERSYCVFNSFKQRCINLFSC
jgi:hypothetical protein